MTRDINGSTAMPAPTLDDPTVICEYAGINLAGPDLKTHYFNMEAVPTADKRTTSHIRVTFQIEFVLLASDAAGTTDFTTRTNMRALRNVLETEGQGLIFTGNGCGDLIVNSTVDGGRTRDVAWGPFPKVLSWKPIGGKRAARVVWACETNIPACPNVNYNGIMELVWRMAFNIDRSGYTTRRYTGHLIIPLNRGIAPSATGRTPKLKALTTADEFRESIIPAPISLYRRIPGGFTVSEDRRTLTWDITDELMPPNIPPENFVDVQATHTISSTSIIGPQGLWKASISGTFEPKYNLSRAQSYLEFLYMVNERRNQTIKAAVGEGGKSSLINLSLTISEPMFARQAGTFTLQYSYVCKLDAFIQASGMWRKTRGEWGKWSVSMRDVLGARGIVRAGLEFPVDADMILSLCEPNSPTQPTDTTNSNPINPVSISDNQLIGNSMPAPEVSWLDYQITLVVEQTDETVQLKTLPSKEIQPNSLQGVQPSGQSPGLQQSSGLGFSGGVQRTSLPLPTTPPSGGPTVPSAVSPIQFTISEVPNVSSNSGPGETTVPSVEAYRSNSQLANIDIEVRTLPTIAIRLVGRAIRAGYPVQSPTIISVGGLPAVPANRGQAVFAHTLLMSAGGVPIYGAVWNQRFLLPGYPSGDWPVPSNPLMQV